MLAVDGAKTAVDVGLFRELLFEKANAEPPQGALQRFDLSWKLHPLSVNCRPEHRNLVEMTPELILCRRLDSPSKTVDRRG